MRLALLPFLLLYQNFCTGQSAPPVGQWREHLPYQQSVELTIAGGKIWSSTAYSVFSVDTADNTIGRLSRVSGLTETGIRTIGASVDGLHLIIAYLNGNIDIVDNANVRNVPDIKASSPGTNKIINQVFSAGGNTWLAADEAIYLLDVNRNEIRDTYIIGDTGNKTATQSLALFNNSLYASTTEGLKFAKLSGPNLSDYRSWTKETVNGLPATPRQVLSTGNNLLVIARDSIYRLQSGAWTLLYGDGWQIKSANITDGKIALHESNGVQARVVLLHASGSLDITVSNSLIKSPEYALLYSDALWLADSISGLLKISSTGIVQLNPSSPATLTTGPLESIAGKMVAVSGGPSTNLEPVGKPGAVSIFNGNSWVNFTPSTLPALDTFTDITTTVIDPLDLSIWAGSIGAGLLNLTESGTIRKYKQNSFIQPTYFSAASYRVSGLAFDKENNLWISNSGAEQNLVVRKPDGSIHTFKVPFPLPESAVAQIVVDDLNQKWIIAPKGNGVIVLNHGQSIDNPGDDQWKWYRTGAGNGSLPNNNVYSMARDKDGFIWLGTAQGIVVIRCIQDVFTNTGCEAIRPIVQQDNFAGYLFSDEEIQAIAVDGANRKWVGTKHGAWLLSADGEKIIYRFSVSNSPLPSDDIRHISIDPASGEVFISTAIGIVSFRSTATEPLEGLTKVLVFPNPVPPSYSGTIAIRGLTNNALVKITELNGNLVFQTRSLGGQAVWNGRDYKGRQISSGVYLVLVTDDQKREYLATKVVYIKK